MIGNQLVTQIQHLAHVRVGHKFIHKKFDTDEAGHLKAVLDADAHEKRERPEQELEYGRDAEVSQVEHAEEPDDAGVHKDEEGREGDQVGEDGLLTRLAHPGSVGPQFFLRNRFLRGRFTRKEKEIFNALNFHNALLYNTFFYIILFSI
jgi:hypothetical protein